MNDSKLEFKVGVFVFLGVTLVALLILSFTKGNTFGKATYTLRVVLPNAAGLKPSADVMMAGVSIGKVNSIELADDTKSVDITVKILAKYKIRKDALFKIDSLGLLSDQYVQVSAAAETGPAPANEAAYLQTGDTVIGEAPFNMLEAVQSISGVIDQARKAIKDLDQAITNVNNSALSPDTLGHFVRSVSNLQYVSERASAAATRVEDLLNTNAAAFDTTIGNFKVFSASLTNTAGTLGEIVDTNRDDVRTFVTNLTEASVNFRKLSSDLQAGKGPINSLLRDEKMNAELASAISNANTITEEISLFGSNLNQKGIWAMLWRPKQPETNRPPAGRGRNR
jgi:phospholipid/cholesterol/gamma-HCH transport system substrate-binding protein